MQRLAMLVLLLSPIVAYAEPAPESCLKPAPSGQETWVQEGVVSFYENPTPPKVKVKGRVAHVKPLQTAWQQPFRDNAHTIAHRTLPRNTKVMVENLDNGRSLTVWVNDRGPYTEFEPDNPKKWPHCRIADLAKGAAKRLGITRKQGLAHAKLTVLSIPRADDPVEIAEDPIETPVRHHPHHRHHHHHR